MDLFQFGYSSYIIHIVSTGVAEGSETPIHLEILNLVWFHIYYNTPGEVMLNMKHIIISKTKTNTVSQISVKILNRTILE